MPRRTLFGIAIANLTVGWLLQTAAPIAAADATRSSVVGAGPAAPALQNPCPTCTTAIGLDAFRTSVGGEIMAVTIEVQAPPGHMRKLAAEQGGRAVAAQKLIGH